MGVYVFPIIFHKCILCISKKKDKSIKMRWHKGGHVFDAALRYFDKSWSSKVEYTSQSTNRNK